MCTARPASPSRCYFWPLCHMSHFSSPPPPPHTSPAIVEPIAKRPPASTSERRRPPTVHHDHRAPTAIHQRTETIPTTIDERGRAPNTALPTSTSGHYLRRTPTTIDERPPPSTRAHHHRRAPTTIDAHPPPSTRAYYHPQRIHNGAQRSPTRLDRTEQRR